MATASDITSGVTGTVRSLGSAMRGLGLATTIGAGIAGAALVSLTQKAERVSTAFREVDTLVQGASNAQEKYGQLVSDLNTEFGLQADKLEVIEGLYQSVSAGVDQAVESQREFLSTAANLAVVGRVELGTAVDVLSTVMNTYGYETSRAEDISETMFQTVQFGKTRMEELAPVIGRVAALGSNLGVQIDEIGASMAVLTRTGFGARVAATGLRNIFRSMLKPSGQMQDTLFQIASEQEFFADSFENSTEKIKGIASDFRNASDAVEEFTQKQEEARSTQESASTAIQEARLKITAIEEDRLDQLPELTKENVKEADSVEELESVISDYQFTVNKARLEEEKFRKEKEEAQSNMDDYQSEISNIIAENGDFQGGIGQLILENQNFVDVMSNLKKEVNDTEVSMTDLYPRTRALQGALALAGEDGSRLQEIFSNMQDEGYDAADAWNNMDESVRENFDSREEFMDTMDQMQAGDLEETTEKALGPQQKLRNSISKLRDSMSALGQTFTEDVVDSFVGFADTIVGLVEKFNSIDETVRENISQFAVLATSIGLLLGPLLFITGQLAVMASVMGVGGLLSFVAPLAIAFGMLASSLQTAISDGEGAGSVFENLRNQFSGIIGFVVLLKDYFVGILIPALSHLGNVFKGVFEEIMSQFGENDDVDSFRVTLFQLFWAMREGIDTIANFIDNNKELIAELTVLAVDVILNKALPAVIELAKGLMAVIQDINWSRLASIAVPMLALLVTGIIKLTRATGLFLQNNSQLIGSLITWAAIIIPVVVAGAKLVAVLASIITAVGAFIGTFKALTAAVYLALQFMGPLQLVLSTLATMFPNLAVVVSALSGAFGVLATVLGAIKTGIMIVVGVISLKIALIVGLIAIIGALAAAIWIVRDNIVKAWKIIAETFMNNLNVIWDLITGEISWEEAGKRIVDNIAKGMMKAKKNLSNAMGKLMDTVTKYLPASPADEGPFSDVAPEEYGKNIGEYTAEGMLSTEGDVEGASGILADSAKVDTEGAEYSAGKDGKGIDVGSDKTGQNMPGDGKGGKEVTVEEGAIKVGPFHGISDEELPGEVREQVQRSLQDLMEEIKGSGKDSTSSLASGDGI